MKILFTEHKKEIGQVLPIVALMFLAIVAMVALVLDGGSIMSQRRTAQAAADAGALAGAQDRCYGISDGLSVAEIYAKANGATSAKAIPVGNGVKVVASVDRSSFFAGIFGESTLKSSAEATAGCFAPLGKAVLPLAWHCLANTAGDNTPFDYGKPCEIQTLSWKDQLGPLVDPNWEPASDKITSLDLINMQGVEQSFTLGAESAYPYSISAPLIVDGGTTMYAPPRQIYIIMNTDKVCHEDDPTSPLICDLNGDGKKDLNVSGDRGFLYLTAETSDIKKSIDNPPAYMPEHIWLSGKSGDVTAEFKYLIDKGLQGKVVLVPVYNTFCPGDPSKTPSCVNEAHEDPFPDGTDIFTEMRAKNDNYHIITFQPFYISCVDKKGNCPGAKYAAYLNEKAGVDIKEIPMIEGFFLEKADVQPDQSYSCDVNLGNCTISLTN